MAPQHSDDTLVMLGQIDGKMDMVLAAVSDHAKRLTVLERDRNRLAGVVAFIGAMSTWWAGKEHLLPALTHLIR